MGRAYVRNDEKFGVQIVVVINVINATELCIFKWLKWKILCYIYFTTIKGWGEEVVNWMRKKNDNSKNNILVAKNKNLKIQANLLCQK